MAAKRIAVVGAGLAGLTAAYRLQQRGAEVVVLEAESRIGGRAYTDELDGFRIDTGAQLVGSMYEAFLRLARELGLGDSVVRSPGRDALWRDGRAHEVVYGSVSSMVASGGLPFTTKMRLGATYVPFLTRNAAALDLHRPELAAEAGLDDETIARWGEREIDRTFIRSLVYPQLGAYYGATPEETSAGFYHILARYGMEVALFALTGGIGEVAERVMQRLIAGGGQVRCDSRVQRLEVGSERVVLRVSPEGRPEEFDGVVTALPAPALLTIADGLPPPLAGWLDGVRYRPTFSVALLLDRPVPVRYFGLSFPQGTTRSVAALCVEQNKCGGLVPDGRGLIVALPTPESAGGLMEADSGQIVDRMLPEILMAVPEVKESISRARVYRWPVGAPVFYPGYLRHLGKFRTGRLEENVPLSVAGEFLYSPSVEGGVLSGEQAAHRLATRLGIG